MKQVVPLVLEAIHLCAFAVWFGGLVTWFILQTALPTSLRALLPPPLQETFFLCGLLLFGTEWLLRRRYHGQKTATLLDSLRQTVVLAALLLEELVRNSDHHTTRHKLEVFMGAQIALLFAVAALSVWLRENAAVATYASASSQLPQRQSPTLQADEEEHTPSIPKNRAQPRGSSRRKY